MARSKGEKRRLAGYALEKNPAWPAIYRFLASLDEEPAERGKTLLAAAERAPRDYALWQEAADALVEGREFALADKALESASRAAPNDAERRRLSDARWELREERAKKEEEERQRQISAERKVIEDLKAKTMERIEEALARANKENEPEEVTDVEVVQFGDLDEEQAAEGALVRVICRSDGQYLLEIKTLEGYARLVLREPESVTTEDGKPWEFRCGAQPNPQVVRATYRPKVSNSLGTIGEVLSLSLP